MRGRATAMLDRVAAETRSATNEAGAALVYAALHGTLALRDDLFDDDHEPRLFHPARTIRILIADAGCQSTAALAAAALVDSVDVGLAENARAAAADLPHDMLELAASVPLPHDVNGSDDDLLERIVTAPHDAAIIALAERLDHARHLHLRNDLDRHSFHASVRNVYATAARRLSPPIARRFDRWADAFERRLVLPR